MGYRGISKKADQTSQSQSDLPPDIRARFRQLFPRIPDGLIEALSVYYTELLRFNKSINLISSTTETQAELLHFADSMLSWTILVKALRPGAPIWDVGSGNGFPGLVYSMIAPDREFILLDRDRKKSEFLKHMISTLKLQNVKVQVNSLEELPQKSLTNLVSRGFAPLTKALMQARKQVAHGGRYFHLKGDGWATELGSVPSQLFSFWTPSLLGQYKIPELPHDMAIVMTEKIAD